jgi:hypothetical protein
MTAENMSLPLRHRLSTQEARVWLVLALVVATVNLVLRSVYLTSIPGVNGDEAMGVVVIREWLLQNGPSFWVTQTGRFIPIFVVLAAPFYALGEPSYLHLRLFAFTAGILTVVAVAFAARAVFHQRWVRVAVVLTSACIPIQLAYSRVAWDPALTSLSAVWFVTLILTGRYAWSLAGAAVGFLIHPTVVFFVPYALLCFAVEVLCRHIKKRRTQLGLVLGLCVAALPVAAYFYRNYVGVGGTGASLDAYGWSTLKSYWLTMGGVISGSVPAESFVAEPRGTARQLLFAVNVIVIVGLGWCTVRALFRNDISWRRRLFPLGVVIGLGMMYVLYPRLDVTHDRYTLVFVIPMVFAFGLAADDSTLSRVALQRLAVLIPAGLLASYCVFYLGAFILTGGPRYSPYHTGAVDPKLAAKAWIVADSRKRLGPEKPIHIVADSWWVFWPIYYLTMDAPRVRVRHVAVADGCMPEHARIKTSGELEQTLRRNGYAVGFSHDALSRIVPTLHNLTSCDDKTFYDFAGRPAVTVHRLCPTE